MDLRDQQQKLTALVENILDEAKRQGADQAEVSVSVDAGLAVSVRKGELENLEFNQDRGFGITLYYGRAFTLAVGTANINLVLRVMNSPPQTQDPRSRLSVAHGAVR